MSTLLDWMFGLKAGTFGAEDSSLGFIRTLPAFIWIAAFILLAILVTRSYRGLSAPRWTRVVLGCVRWCVVVLLLVLAMGPQIQRSRTLIEPDRVIVLLDASGSMNTPEVDPDGSLTTRAAILSDLLETNDSVFEQIAEDSAMDLYTFTNHTTKHASPLSIDPEAIAPSASTALGRSIQSALSAAGTNPISGIVVFSDGQSHDQPSPALLESLISSGIPVISVPIGSSEPVHDASIRMLDSPHAVFAKDRVPIRIHANAAGYDEGDEILFELIDQSTGQTLASTTQSVGDEPSITADLSHIFEGHGTKKVIVRLTPQGSSPDLVSDNNEQPIELRVVSEPMRVLYIDGQPRWEYRYLKNTLMREDTIDATTMLLASDRRFIEEGQPLSGPIPDSLETWEPFDVVILGDVRPELFSEPQLSSLKEHIETRGGGLLWIAGEGATPSAWTGTELAPLLPMQSGKSSSISSGSRRLDPVVMQLTELASQAGLLVQDDLSLSTSHPVSDPDAGWTILRWNASVALEDLKPGVSALALAQTIGGDSDAALVTSMRYGGGQIGYVGTDEIWRWRYGRGEDLPEKFWLPLIRTLARGTIDRRASSVALSVSPSRIIPRNVARATLDIFDSAVIESLPNQINAEITSLSTNQPGTPITLTGTGPRRSTLWNPGEPGVYSMSVSHPLIGSDPITTTVRVHSAWDEINNLNTDHAALQDLSAATIGQLLNPDRLSELPDILPNRTRITILPPQTTPLWDRPIVLVILVLLLSIEWIGRRTLRLA